MLGRRDTGASGLREPGIFFGHALISPNESWKRSLPWCMSLPQPLQFILSRKLRLPHLQHCHSSYRMPDAARGDVVRRRSR